MAKSARQRLSPYATPSATREVLERHGLFTKYAFGQNFLVNDDVVQRIVELADISKDDHVLEVGPGIGTLSAALLKRAGHVTAIEVDYALPAVLNDTLSEWIDSFTLINKDALDVEAQDLSAPAAPEITPYPNKLVSNLPYAVAATVVLDYAQRFDFLRSMTVMVQKEVADRMMAQPGSKTYGAYTVKLSLYMQAQERFSVAPGNFFPPPHVESSVIRLNAHTPCDSGGQPASPELLSATCLMADAAFATRRKTLANSCKTFFAQKPQIKEALPQIFAQADISPQVRGETLTQADYLALGQAYLDISSALSD